MNQVFNHINLTTLLWLCSVGFSLAQTKQELQTQLAKHKNINKKLITEKIQLEYIQTQIRLSKDSTQSLLDAARYRERLYRAEALRLKGLLEKWQNQIDSLQTAYDDLAKGASSTLREYRQEIEKVTKERNKLAQDNVALQNKLNQLTSVPSTLFPFNITAIPGKLQRERFKPINRAKQIELIDVHYQLTQAPRMSDTIKVRVYNQAGKLMPIKVKTSSPWNRTQQKERVLFTTNNKGWLPGRYIVRLYWSNHQKNIVDHKVGLTEFILR